MIGRGGEERGQLTDRTSEERRRVLRLYFFGIICTLWFAAIGVRLWDLQVRQAGALTSRATRQQEGSITMFAERGGIYDRNGVGLALSSPFESIAVYTPRIGDKDLMADVLADVTGMPRAEIRSELDKKGFRFIQRFAPPAAVERLKAMNLRGLQFDRESRRLYPKGSVAAHVLGYVDIDQKGQGGLESQFNEILEGRNGRRRVSVDAGGEEYDFEIVEPPIPGSDLFLTIDQRIQAVAEDSLRNAVEETKSRAGAIVVLDPYKGDVLAMANWPTFDPNVRPKGRTEEELLKDLKRRQNYAISHLYEPGSTFKVVTVAAAIEESVTRPEEIIDCQDGWMYVGRRRIRDHKRFGPLSVTDVLARSSNVGVIKLGLRLGPGRMRQYVSDFGFGGKTGIELPGEISGLLRPLKEWREGSIASISMGHEIGATPLQMAAATAVVANGGHWVKPRIVDAVREPSGRIRQLDPSPRNRVISEQTAAKVRAMMEQTVLNGTAKLAAVSGYRSGGKTGTAQMIDPETRAYSHDLYMAGYAAFAPLNDPSMVAVIVLEAPQGQHYYGGLTAAPVFPALAESTLRFRDVPPQLPAEEQEMQLAEIAPESVADLAVTTTTDDVEEPRHELASDGAIYVSMRSTRPFPLEENAAEAAEASEARTRRPANLRVTEILTPDFHGMTVREAVAEGMALGLRLETLGDGVALTQEPSAGTPIARGSRVLLHFGRMTAQMSLDR